MQFEELSTTHAAPFLKFVADLRDFDRATFDHYFQREWSPEEFKTYVRECAAERLDWRPKARQVSRTRYLMTDDQGVAGFAVLQFPLGDQVEANFQFIVPPSRRGRGFGTLTLNHLLFEGARAGLARALVACATANTVARTCIERNRGQLDQEVNGQAFYWLRLR